MSSAGSLCGLATAMILAVLTASGGLAAIAEQDEITTIRSGDHPGFSRVAIDTNARAAYHVDQTGDRVIVRFLSPVVLGKPPSAPRNVVAIKTLDQTIELTIKSGSTIRSGRIGDRFFIDIVEPDQTSAARQARKAEVVPLVQTVWRLG
jgi:hypothetical protein